MNADLYIKAISSHDDAAWDKVHTEWEAIQAKYPLLFTGRNIGTEGGFGWWAILEKAFAELTALMEMHPAYKFNTVQIKEKFGGLRFYVHINRADATDDDEDDDSELVDTVLTHLYEQSRIIIEQAEQAAYHTCEWCGEPGKARTKGWIKVLCDEHSKLNDKLRGR